MIYYYYYFLYYCYLFTIVTERGPKATSQGRRQLEESYLVDMMQSFENDDSLMDLSLNELCQKLSTDNCIPSDYEFCLRNNCLFIYYLQISDKIPVIRCCLTLDDEKKAIASVDGKTVPTSQLNDLLHKGKKYKNTHS
jgi:hypothetical protein